LERRWPAGGCLRTPMTEASTHEDASPVARRSIESTLSRALLTSYLVTSNLPQAEQAVLKGIDSLDGDVEKEDVLLCSVIAAAVQATPHPQSYGTSRLTLSGELQAVLTLEPTLRGCFVLRRLAGLSSQACAQFLRLLPEQVDEYTGIACRELGDRVPTMRYVKALLRC